MDGTATLAAGRAAKNEAHGLPCPLCGAPTRVTDARPTDLDGLPATRRRRLCERCGVRSTSYELYGSHFDPALLSATEAMTKLAPEHRKLVWALLVALKETKR